MPDNSLQSASIHKCQETRNMMPTHMCQTKSLQTASIPQVPRTASAHLGNLQPALNYIMPIKSLQTASKTLLTTFKKLANSFYSPGAKNCFSISMPACNLLSITLCESKACKLLQFTSAKNLQTDVNSQVQNKS